MVILHLQKPLPQSSSLPVLLAVILAAKSYLPTEDDPRVVESGEKFDCDAPRGLSRKQQWCGVLGLVVECRKGFSANPHYIGFVACQRHVEVCILSNAAAAASL